MAKNFITNNKTRKSLKGRLNTLISISDELKFLVGFFYFSGWRELFESLKKNEVVQLKLMVGLQVDQLLNKIVEHGQQEEGLSQDEQFQQFMSSLGLAVNNEELDTEEFYNQVEFFLKMLEEDRLLIRKTENPNHAKLYLFRLGEEQAKIQDMEGQFVTGSSNLTKAGLHGQEEFNVEIKDYGFEEAEQYFDELWARAIPISEVEQRKEFLIKFIRHKSQAATVTPYEAYALILKTYLDLQQQKQIKPEVENIIEQIGFKKYSYQLDAVNQALSIIEEYNGVIIADVVGLGKSVIASLIAKNLGRRGMVICPPGLMGDRLQKTGWHGYINDFKLHDWEVESRGTMLTLADTMHDRGIEVVIVDEAHYYRNQDTEDYEALKAICQDKIVILLTATPFNNSPADIFSLLKLFIVPGKSGITLEDNLDGLFRAYNYRFKKLSDISKNYDSPNPKKRRRAETLYTQVIGQLPPVDIGLVREETHRLANQIKGVISPVVIRRNRIDLKQDHQYSSELGDLSRVENPQELFFYLTEQQSTFYDKLLQEYFVEDGRFKGAIYQPYSYEKIGDEEDLEQEENFQFQSQRNLYDFMRRLLVKRFESSFGAFANSIDRFLKTHEIVQDFVKENGKFILDRKLIEKIWTYDPDEIMQILDDFENDLLSKKTPKNNTVYVIDEFQLKDEFLADIESDRKLFEELRDELQALNLTENDPKKQRLLETINEITEKDPRRKVIVFSEYVDTIKHLEPYLRQHLGNRLLVCDGAVSKQLAKDLNSDFNAQFKGSQTNHFDVLITSDKLSEGFNLNRAGVIVNYDIPWNPTRVIQRVGRINRIGAKVFDSLFIYNFFPSEIGADVVKSREIASQKMFLIHSSLGEDAKIFEADEEPTASELFRKVNESPDEDDEINTITEIRNRFAEIIKRHPDVIQKISDLPPRIKSAKAFTASQLTVLRKKGLSLFPQLVADPNLEKNEVQTLLFEEYLPFVECVFEETRLDLSPKFWSAYEAVKNYRPQYRGSKSEVSLEKKAVTNCKVALKIIDPQEEVMAEFIRTLLRDIKKYHTLPKRTLGRIGRKSLSPNSNKKEREAFFSEIRYLMNRLGTDYLERILKRVEGQKSEVIIAIENRIKTD